MCIKFVFFQVEFEVLTAAFWVVSVIKKTWNWHSAGDSLQSYNQEINPHDEVDTTHAVLLVCVCGLTGV